MLDETDFLADDEVPRSRVAVPQERFSRLSDEREPWWVMHPLSEVVLPSTRATVA